ncbi:hypothetical protein BDV95DRAFT_612568 [Massariosphaeria phaeospora]|uniref:F-box domain-containing protein n=1 Tax=Massariosphaeria phaeospora TaxID=100035 RepID=A0A7C8M1N7_9PLEO|nr:hypothetical protein BDV95DRAFT_612568 [Massariosphaeria phaeospora]
MAAPRQPPSATPAPRPTIALSVKDGIPITAPHHSWFTSPASSHTNHGRRKELPLHLLHLILEYLDDVADLARITRTSRLFYYMTLPRLYESVTLRSYADIRYVNGRPEGYGNGSPFALGLNTLVSRTFGDYVQTFRVLGDWKEHDLDDYSKGRVPDNSMMLQIALRAALDRMKNLTAFAWQLDTKPLLTVYQGLMANLGLTSLTLRCPTKRIPRPTSVIPPLPNLRTLVLYDIDPLCYPDDISLLLLTAKKLENLKLHWTPRMRESGEESVNLLNYFGRCVAAQYQLPVKRMALYNLYARHPGSGFSSANNPSMMEEMTIINSMGSNNPMTVFLDDTWRVNSNHPVPHNLKMLRADAMDKEQAAMLARIYGMERLYFISKGKGQKTISTAATPTTPSSAACTPSVSGGSSASMTVTEQQCKTLASDFLAVIQSNHRTMRHLLLPDLWQLSDDTLFRICQSCPDLEQFGFSCAVPPMASLRQIFALVPKLQAMRILVRPGSEFDEAMGQDDGDMHEFALATELWRPEYKNLKYVGFGDRFTYKLGAVKYPPNGTIGKAGMDDNSMNARRRGPMRTLTRMEREDVVHIEIWGLDTTEFDPKFP